MAAEATKTRTEWQAPDLARALDSVRAWIEGEGALAWPPSLELLAALFDLSRFEAEVVLLCMAAELDPTVASAIAREQGAPEAIHPTFGLALAKLAEPHWEALAPHAPLRQWELVQLGGGPTLLASPLKLDERILHFLVGAHAIDPRIAARATPLAKPASLVESHLALASKIEKLWSSDSQAIYLAGSDSTSKRDIAAHVASNLGCRVYEWPLETLPEPAQLDQLLRLWKREAALSRAIFVLNAEHAEAGRDQSQVERIAAKLAGPLFVLVRQRWTSLATQALTLNVERAARPEQAHLWRTAAGESSPGLEDELRRVTTHFSFSAESIRTTVNYWRASQDQTLWTACRENARGAMDGLAQRLTPRAEWKDLILGEDWKRILRMITAQVRNRARVYEDWQLAERGPSGLGITALFAGPSGTGKTLAAEVIAKELDLDLCRVDLSQMVSKYIGETEKNISRVCEAAEESGAVLLFDEADALFGKRSEVKDSHDRHANIEVSYLLQRMEVYQGLAILTTNLADNIDQAFLRRLRFVIPFPLPDAQDREDIWRRMFPDAVPLEGVDFPKLAKLQIPGGNIRNIAVLAMFLAAEKQSGVTMPLLLEAARVEYAKIERTLRPTETEGWA